MRTRILLLSVAAFLGTTQLNFGQDAKKDADKLQGTWEVVEFVVKGKSVENERRPKRLIFEAGKLTFAAERKFTFTLDEKAKPKTIDLTSLDGAKVILGIYRFDGNKLELCLQNGPDEARPKEFATEGKSLLHFVLQREKK